MIFFCFVFEGPSNLHKYTVFMAVGGLHKIRNNKERAELLDVHQKVFLC